MRGGRSLGERPREWVVFAAPQQKGKPKAPARFDEDLLIISTAEGVRPVGCTIHQRVMRGDQLLTDARVTAAFLSTDGRPRRQPAEWIERFRALSTEGE